MTFIPNRNELTKIRPRMDSLYVNSGRTSLATDRDGMIANGEHGLFFWQTRVLSKYEVLVNGTRPVPVALSNCGQGRWFGYYVIKSAVQGAHGKADLGSGQVQPETVKTLELTIERDVAAQMREKLRLTNYTQESISFELALIIDADFADVFETTFRRVQKGCREKTWHSKDGVPACLEFHYAVRREYVEQNESGRAEFAASLRAEFLCADAAPAFDADRVRFKVQLEPLASWQVAITFTPTVSGKIEDARFTEIVSSAALDDVTPASAEGTRFSDPEAPYLQSVVLTALEQVQRDLESLRLRDLDLPNGWTMAAGAQNYSALFGRDVLTASWQAALLGPEMMVGALAAVASRQGTRFDEWRDEEPGKMLHEAHTGPMSLLNFFPRSRYYGSSTTSILFPLVVAELWHWTGDRELIAPYIEPALKALRWLDQRGDLDQDGFYEYRCRSKRGTRHQGWKDSDDAIVDEHGKQLHGPIAMAEEQAFAYVSKRHFAETLLWFGRLAEARALARQARELKRRFNDAFWLADLGYIAMGLDREKRPIRSIGSDPGHCLAAGILDESLITPVANRLMSPDLFSGWGIRTLSSEHPAFNPYSYHRGSIWPVENGTFALGLVRSGLHQHAETLSRAVFEACSMFESYRLPELFSGHPRDERHPFPALYPRANFPQAWSSSSLLCILQSLLGLYPYAPLQVLIIDPHLPVWLPRLTLHDLRVGQARLTISFMREADGSSSYRIIDLKGKLSVLRQPNPWSLTAGWGERAKGALQSLMH